MSAQTSSDKNGWDFKLWQAQTDTWQALHSGDYDLVVYRGGYGSGKTIVGVRWIITTALNIPKSDNLIIAPDSKKGGATTYKAFFEELPGQDTVPDEGGDPENSPIIKKYHSVEKRATFMNGAVVRLGSADKWNRYAGGEFNAIYCDEVAHYDNTNVYDLHEMLISRQRTADGPNVTLWTSTGNGYEQFYDITERKVDGDEKDLHWKDTMKVIVANSLDNPFLNEKDKLIRQFQGTEREAQALQGGFSSATGLVYSDFTRRTHVRDDDSMPELRPERYYAYDHGWKDPRVLLEIAMTVNGQYAVIDEYYREKEGVEKLVGSFDGKKLTRKGWLQKQNKKEGTVYSEHEPEHIEAFRKAGFDVEAAIKDLDEGIPEVRRFVETDEEGTPGLLVHDDCTNTIKEFQSYKEEEVGKSKATDHAMDALRYCIATRELDTDTTPSIEDSFTF